MTFFKHETHPNCSFSPPIAPLDNQKNGWNCVCIYHETNEEEYNCLIQASLGQWYTQNISNNHGSPKTLLSVLYTHDQQFDLAPDNMIGTIKLIATALNYLPNKVIPITSINTHSLQSGGMNVLALSGYGNTQMQKMGQWQGATFNEYIQEELACYSARISSDVRQKFIFFYVTAHAFHDVTNQRLLNALNTNLLLPSKKLHLTTSRDTTSFKQWMTCNAKYQKKSSQNNNLLGNHAIFWLLPPLLLLLYQAWAD